MSTETEADTSTLEALDFEVRCEALTHQDDHPAKLINRGICPACHGKVMRFVCDEYRTEVIRFIASGWETEHVSGCGALTPTGDWHYTFTPLPGVTS